MKNKTQRKLNTVTKQELGERINIIEMLILKGYNWIDIYKLISNSVEYDWKVTRRTMYRYYVAAKARTTKLISENELKSYLRQTLKRYNLLFKQSQAMQDFRTCNAINKNIADLLQLNEYSKQILNVPTDNGLQEIKVEIIERKSDSGISE